MEKSPANSIGFRVKCFDFCICVKGKKKKEKKSPANSIISEV
jgi:hypothetical protein